MQIQNDLGSDIMMAFDECPPMPAEYKYVKIQLNVQQDGLNDVLKHINVQRTKHYLVLYKVEYKDLREQSAKELVSLIFLDMLLVVYL